MIMLKWCHDFVFISSLLALNISRSINYYSSKLKGRIIFVAYYILELQKNGSQKYRKNRLSAPELSYFRALKNDTIQCTVPYGKFNFGMNSRQMSTTNSTVPVPDNMK